MSTQEKLVMKLIDEICDYDEYCGDENCKQCGGPIKFWKKKLTDLIDSAKREGFLEGQLESLGKVTKENFMYRCLYGELPLDYKGVDLLEAYKSYRENDSFRENFARYVEQVAVELEQSEESE